jgi:hypothetical protein
LKVDKGWLTGRGAPLDVQRVRSWGADVVLSLVNAATFSRQQKHAIFEEAEEAGTVKEYRQFQVDPISRGEPTAKLCKQLANLVAYAEDKIRKGNRVAVHSRQGQPRTGVAIYLLMRMGGDLRTAVPSRMKTMYREMHDDMIDQEKRQDMFTAAEEILGDGRFKWALDMERNIYFRQDHPDAPARLP